jgi:hypothetical protein
MQTEHIGEYLYEFVTQRMNEKDHRFWEAHIGQCVECQMEVAEMSKVLGLLNQVETPLPSEAFKNDLARKLRTAPLPEKPFTERIREWFQVPSLRWSLRGAAVAAVLLLSLIAIRDFFPESEKIDKTPRGGITIGEVKPAPNPIVIETKSVEESLQRLKEIIQSHQGSLVRRRPVADGLEVTFKVGNEEEQNLIRSLDQLGNVKREEQGFKDGEGNLVILLRGK